MQYFRNDLKLTQTHFIDPWRDKMFHFFHCYLKKCWTSFGRNIYINDWLHFFLWQVRLLLTSNNTTKADFYPSFLFFDFSFSSIFFSVGFHYNYQKQTKYFQNSNLFSSYTQLEWCDWSKPHMLMVNYDVKTAGFPQALTQLLYFSRLEQLAWFSCASHQLLNSLCFPIT